jgi:ribosome-binding protein aMBF1 (putative translation factor)
MAAWRGTRKLRHPSQEPSVPKTLRSRGHKALLAVLVASRREAGLTQRQLAERLKVPPSVVGKIETGERRLDVVEFIAIAKVLKVEPALLITRVVNWGG